ncbi:DUF3871 family protein [Mangrovimonas cancribranchiae]|uniref:DUF3871 family protein n=1 Tax=Mangrovimonas cancribranchiae TaxID=3080055 RepID=A0AAU6NW73_9FLAO
MEDITAITTQNVVVDDQVVTQSERQPFIVANTEEVTLNHLERDCIIPVFSKDNETTIAHHEFINTLRNQLEVIMPEQQIQTPEIRVSHVVKGRVPSAIGKPAKELLEEEKTIYYERMAFNILVPSISRNINGNMLHLSIGGVRAYNQENLYSKKSPEKFKLFIGFRNNVCTNLCVSTDGFLSDIRVSSVEGLCKAVMDLFKGHSLEEHLMTLQDFNNYTITEEVFAHLIGKLRMQPYRRVKNDLDKSLEINDSQINKVVKGFYKDQNFKSNSEGKISLWQLYNLFTGANKSSYIDSFVDRSLSAFVFVKEIGHSIKNQTPNRYLNN